jgi:hypothetical protein
VYFPVFFPLSLLAFIFTFSLFPFLYTPPQLAPGAFFRYVHPLSSRTWHWAFFQHVVTAAHRNNPPFVKSMFSDNM